MMSRDETRVSREAAAKAQVDVVKGIYQRTERDGVLAGVKHMLTCCHDDVTLRSYSAHAAPSLLGDGAELLRGHDEILAFFERAAAGGFESKIRTRGFDVEGDTVVVRGSIRVARPDGSFAETSVRWDYRFSGGLIEEVSWAPRAGD
jgi:hypothetical protein